MKNFHLIILILLVACGKKQAISYQEYQQKHQQTRERHIQLIKSNASVFDTLCSQDIDLIQQKKDQRLILDCWENTAQFLEEMCIRHEIYSHEVVLNDSTFNHVMKMWEASSKISQAESTQSFDILMIVKYNDDPSEAIPIIEELQKIVRKQMEAMLEGAEEYQEIVFGDPKTNPN